MNVFWIVGIIFLGYVCIVALAEVAIRVFQPDMDGGITLFVTDGQGGDIKRNLAVLVHNEALYISSNHWVRKWYYAVLKNPDVEGIRHGERAAYTAVPINGQEWISVSRNYKMGLVLRMVCGFAPSRFLRLDPR